MSEGRTKPAPDTPPLVPARRTEGQSLSLVKCPASAGQGETPASGVKSADQNMEYLADRIVPQNSLGTPASVEISAQIIHMSNGLKTQKRDGIHQVPTFF